MKCQKSKYKFALSLAVEYNHLSCVLLLLDEAGMQTESGHTALMMAVSNGYALLASVLAQRETGIQDNDGMSALMYAA